MCKFTSSVFFFFNDTATTEIYTLSLHDALPICRRDGSQCPQRRRPPRRGARAERSEEHTSELQSHSDLVCRLLLEKKKTSIVNQAELDVWPPSRSKTRLHRSVSEPGRPSTRPSG